MAARPARRVLTMTSPHDGSDHLLALGRYLRALREQAGLTGGQLAQALGWKQPRVSRLELARQNISPADVDAWVAATGGTERDRTLLLGMLDQAREDQHAWRSRFRRGQASVQAGYNTLMARTRRVRVFTTAIIPGMLQTPAYAAAVLTAAAWQAGTPTDDVAEAVDMRMRRQAYLDDSRRRFHFLLHEPALHPGLASTDVMREQLNRLTELDRPNVRLAVLPLGVPLNVMPLHGFTMLDDLVVVETLSREHRYSGPEADAYMRAFSEMWSAALTGDEARATLQRVTEE
ncbi:helix-turn-helix transcriptional regulator [Myceligenerans halotolerans]